MTNRQIMIQWLNVLFLIILRISSSEGFSTLFPLRSEELSSPYTKVKCRQMDVLKGKFDDNLDDEDNIPGYSNIFEIPGGFTYLTAS